MPRRTRLTPAELYLRPPVPEFEERPFLGPAVPLWPCSFVQMPPELAAGTVATASPGEIAAGRVVNLTAYRQARRRTAAG